MGRPTKTPPRPRELAAPTVVAIGAVCVVAFYWARIIFVPLFLAILLTLVLSPLVRFLEHRGLRRGIAAFITVTAAAALMITLVWLVASETMTLLANLPSYTENVVAKVRTIKHLGGDATLDRIAWMAGEIGKEWEAPPISEAAVLEPAEDQAAPLPDEQQVTDSGVVQKLSTIARPIIEMAFSLGLAFVLLFFLLLRRESFRNRMIRLLGGQLSVTTKALDDAAERISRYLRVQLMINAIFGCAWGGALFMIGVDYAVLWGVLGALLRYFPYVGPFMGGMLPLTIVFAEFPGWSHLLIAVAVYLTLETLTNSVLEPFFYSSSMGVTEVAFILSATFWALLWGPIGLILAGPLTVCLVVLGRHVVQLRHLALLLGDEPALEPEQVLYQRLLARDEDEGLQLALSYVGTQDAEFLFDNLLLPCLSFLKQDHDAGLITPDDELFVTKGLRDIMHDIESSALERGKDEANTPTHAKSIAPGSRVRILAYPAHDVEDRLALEMFRSVMDEHQWDIEIVGLEAMTSDLLSYVKAEMPPVVCIGAVPPGSLAHCRHICKRLRKQLPEIKIAIGRWAPASSGADLDQLKGIGADFIAGTLKETRNQLEAWLPVLSRRSATSEPSRPEPA